MKMSELDKLRDELKGFKESLDTESGKAGEKYGVAVSNPSSTNSAKAYPGFTVTSTSYHLASSVNGDSYNICLNDTLEDILTGLRSTLLDRESSLKKHLQDLSNDYEKVENELHTVTEKIRSLESIISKSNTSDQKIILDK